MFLFTYFSVQKLIIWAKSICFLTASYKGFGYLCISSSVRDCSFTHNHLQRSYNLKEKFVIPLGKKKKKKGKRYFIRLICISQILLLGLNIFLQSLITYIFLMNCQLVSIVYCSVCVVCFFKYYFDFLDLYELWILISDVLDMFKIFKYVIK